MVCMWFVCGNFDGFPYQLTYFINNSLLDVREIPTRRREGIVFSLVKSNHYKFPKNPYYRCMLAWNHLPVHISLLESKESFTTAVKGMVQNPYIKVLKHLIQVSMCYYIIFFFFNCMFHQLLCVQHICSSTQSWGSVLPSIVETGDQNSRGCPLLFSNRNLGSFCA